MAFWLTVLQERANWLHFPIHHPPALDFRVVDSISMLRGTLAHAFIHESEANNSQAPWVDPLSVKFKGRKFPRSRFFFDDVTRRLSWWSLLSAQSRRFHFRFSRSETRTHFFPLSWPKSEENVCEKTFLIKSELSTRWKRSFRWKLSRNPLGSVGAASRSPTRATNGKQTRGEEKMIKTQNDCVKDTSSQ